MNALDLFILDFNECRRRFLMVAEGFPNQYLAWRPDEKALGVGETIRHVLLHDLSWLTGKLLITLELAQRKRKE
jgi:hypothetical protein